MIFGYYLLEACSCLMRDGKRVDLYERGGGEKLGRVDGGETVIYYYCYVIITGEQDLLSIKGKYVNIMLKNWTIPSSYFQLSQSPIGYMYAKMEYSLFLRI